MTKYQELEKEIEDNYKEHSFHIVGAQGKIVPFWKNKNTCSTCYSEHMKIKNTTPKIHNSPESREDYRNEVYRIN